MPPQLGLGQLRYNCFVTTNAHAGVSLPPLLSEVTTMSPQPAVGLVEWKLFCHHLTYQGTTVLS